MVNSPVAMQHHLIKPSVVIVSGEHIYFGLVGTLSLTYSMYQIQLRISH